MPHLVAAAKTLASLCLLEKFDYVFFSFLFFVVVVVHYNFSFFSQENLHFKILCTSYLITENVETSYIF